MQGNALASDEMQQLASEARESLQLTWETHYRDFKTQGYTNDQVPVKDRAIFEHVCSFLLIPHRVRAFTFGQT